MTSREGHGRPAFACPACRQTGPATPSRNRYRRCAACGFRFKVGVYARENAAGDKYRGEAIEVRLAVARYVASYDEIRRPIALAHGVEVIARSRSMDRRGFERALRCALHHTDTPDPKRHRLPGADAAFRLYRRITAFHHSRSYDATRYEQTLTQRHHDYTIRLARAAFHGVCVEPRRRPPAYYLDRQHPTLPEFSTVRVWITRDAPHIYQCDHRPGYGHARGPRPCERGLSLNVGRDWPWTVHARGLAHCGGHFVIAARPLGTVARRPLYSVRYVSKTTRNERRDSDEHHPPLVTVRSGLAVVCDHGPPVLVPYSGTPTPAQVRRAGNKARDADADARRAARTSPGGSQ